MSKYPVASVTVSATIPASPEEVFHLINDTRNDPKWCPNVDSVELVDGDDIGVGTTFHFHQHVERPGGKRLEFDANVEVISLDAGAIAWKVEDRFQTRSIEVTVVPEGDGTRITQKTRASFHKKPKLTARYGYPIVARRTLKDQFHHLAEYFADK